MQRRDFFACLEGFEKGTDKKAVKMENFHVYLSVFNPSPK